MNQDKTAGSETGSRNKYFKILSGVAIVAIIIIGLFYREGGWRFPFVSPREYQSTRFYMDTYIQVIVVSRDRKSAEKAQEEAFDVFARMQDKFNFYDNNSLLQATNRRLQERITDPDMKRALWLSMGFAGMTGGAFDPTLGSVKVLYPFGKENPVPPQEKEIKKALKSCGYRKMNFDGNLMKKPSGMLLDLGGVIKGYAVDMAIERLWKSGVRNALVNGGGNIRVLGRNAHGGMWKVGVENPRSPGNVYGVMELENGQAVATSGDYQRYFFYQGKRYHHILNPATGLPADKAISVTVPGPSAVACDAFSTAVFVMGREKGLKFLEKNSLHGIIVDDRGKVTTRGIRNVRFEEKTKEKS